MEAAHLIRDELDKVHALRTGMAGDVPLAAAVRDVKRFQARRFAGTYADLLGGGQYQAASRFFLEELYSDRDYADRDAQFTRIAGAIERFFPAQVAATAAALAGLHALTEVLDHAMGVSWRSLDGRATESGSARYVRAWREVGRREDRQRQLTTVLGIGQEMVRLTRTPGLRLLLRMMRGPAVAAGLADLQKFLEAGFDTFADMARHRNSAEAFLATIESRESALLTSLFDDEFVTCETKLEATLGLAR